jgi:hypothetical protein
MHLLNPMSQWTKDSPCRQAVDGGTPFSGTAGEIISSLNNGSIFGQLSTNIRKDPRRSPVAPGKVVARILLRGHPFSLYKAYPVIYCASGDNNLSKET